LDALHLRMGMSVTTLLLVLFWTAYSLRFIVDAAILQLPLGSLPAADMAAYLFAICLPTFIVLYLIRDIRLYRKALTWSMLSLGVCCLVSMLRTRTAKDVVLHGGGYQGNEILNHISYGHMGVTAVILGLFVLLQIGHLGRPWYLRLLAAGVVCLGAFSMLASASRGALVAGVILVPVVAYLGFRRGSRLLTIGICIVLGFSLSVTLTYLSKNGAKLDRIIGAASAYSIASNGVYERQSMITDAWNEYLEHPWLGSSIVERRSLSYPHNAIVEAFMATGAFGGTVFALLVLTAIYRASSLIRRHPAMAWVPICFFQQLIGAMFSGGLYGNPLLWGMMAIMLGVDMPPRRSGKAEIRDAYAW
jgi:O-antigen ligase